MSNVKTLTSLAAASLLVTGLSACATKPHFHAKPMKHGYQNTKNAEGTCGGKQADAKCGAKNAEGTCGGKQSEGKCGAQ